MNRCSESQMYYASRLMRLRAQLRTPSLSSFNYHDLPTTARPEYIADDEEEDDQESYQDDDDDDDNASQLTNLSELVRASIYKKQTRHYTDGLALPPKPVDKRSAAIPLRSSRKCFTSFALASEHLLRQEQQGQMYYDDDDDDDTCSTASSDSWSSDDNTSLFAKRRIHSSPLLYNDSSSSLDSSSVSTIVSEERRLPRPATAYFISLSPSAAAAASVARKRRWQARPTWKRNTSSPLPF